MKNFGACIVDQHLKKNNKAKEIIDKELFEYYDSINVECEEIFEKEKESFFKKICVVTFPKSTVVRYYKPSNLRHDGELIYTYFEDETGVC